MSNSLDHLSEGQRGEVEREMGSRENGISPEGVEHAIERYLASLRTQASAARSFFFGRWEEGWEQLLDLPDEVRMQIDQLIWEAAGEEALDPAAPESGKIAAAAVLRSLEKRIDL